MLHNSYMKFRKTVNFIYVTLKTYLIGEITVICCTIKGVVQGYSPLEKI